MRQLVAAAALSFAIAVNTSASPASSPADREGGSVDPSPVSELVRYGVTQGGLFLLLVYVLWRQQGDVKRQVEHEQERTAEEREDKRIILDALEKSTQALRDTAVANAHQTDATNRLANLIDALARRPS